MKYIRLLLRWVLSHIFLLIRWLITIPLEIIKVPVFYALHFSSIIGAVGTILFTIVYFYNGDARLLPGILYGCLLASGSQVFKYAFSWLVQTINPLYYWLDRRIEEKYFDQEYRLGEYKATRRKQEQGYNADDVMLEVLKSQQRMEKQQRNFIEHQQQALIDQKIDQQLAKQDEQLRIEKHDLH